MNLPPYPHHWRQCHQARKGAELRAGTGHPNPAEVVGTKPTAPPLPPAPSPLPVAV